MAAKIYSDWAVGPKNMQTVLRLKFDNRYFYVCVCVCAVWVSIRYFQETNLYRGINVSSLFFGYFEISMDLCLVEEYTCALVKMLYT